MSKVNDFYYHYPMVAAAAAKSLQSCPTLWDPIDGSPPGSPIPGIFQARTLEWVAISFPNAWKWKVKVKSLTRVQLLAAPWTAAYQAPLPMGFSRQEYWSGCHWRFPYSIFKQLQTYLWTSISVFFFSATHFLVYKEFPGILNEKSNFTVLIYMSMTLREILPIKEFSFNFHRNGKSNCSSDLLQLPLLFHSSRFSFIWKCDFFFLVVKENLTLVFK